MRAAPGQYRAGPLFDCVLCLKELRAGGLGAAVGGLIYNARRSVVEMGRINLMSLEVNEQKQLLREPPGNAPVQHEHLDVKRAVAGQDTESAVPSSSYSPLSLNFSSCSVC